MGIKFKPSGSFVMAEEELFTKANRAWYSVSNLIYQNKRWSIDRALRLFDRLVLPVATYACEFWIPFVLPKKSFESQENLMKSFEKLRAETLNQKLCRMLLSVHNKATRLAVLSELGRYPVLISSLTQLLKYHWSLMKQKNSDTLIGSTLREMEVFSDQGKDCWLTRTNSIKSVLKIPEFPSHFLPKTTGNKIKDMLNSCFESFWKTEINAIKANKDGRNTNKLRFYKTLKGSFSREPYIDLVPNRSQRSWLSRLRISAHHLGVEIGRYTRPITPLENRTCNYCKSGEIDHESHFLTKCSICQAERNCLFARMETVGPGFLGPSKQNKVTKLLCPTNATSAKLINTFISLVMSNRRKLDEGHSASMLGLPDIQNG